MTHTMHGPHSLEIARASADEQPTVANLLELYVYDFSALVDLRIGNDGRFGYPDLDLYWADSNHHPFLIRVNGGLTGLALVREDPESANEARSWDMTEFFVLRSFRDCGVGTQAAIAVWRMFPGRWQVRVMRKNEAALGFWRRSISLFAGERVSSSQVQKNHEPWEVFYFDSPS